MNFLKIKDKVKNWFKKSNKGSIKPRNLEDIVLTAFKEYGKLSVVNLQAYVEAEGIAMSTKQRNKILLRFLSLGYLKSQKESVNGISYNVYIYQA